MGRSKGTFFIPPVTGCTDIFKIFEIQTDCYEDVL